VASVLAAVAAWSGRGRGPDDAWIVGTGFDETAWADKRLPTRAELDRIHPHRPVLLQRVCGHVGVANTIALGFATDGPHTDRTSGRLAEDDLYVLNDVVRPTAGEFAAVLPDVVALLHRHGITAVHDVSSPEMVQALAQRSDPGVRATCSIPARYVTDARQPATTLAAYFAARGLDHLPLGGPDAPFQVLGLKVFVDGSLGARTACLRAPYADAPATHGSALYAPAELHALLRDADAAGLQLMVHAIGDAGLDRALDALRPLVAGGNPLRHRIEHAEVTPPDVVARLAESGLWACLQPNFAARWSQPGGMNEQRLGARLRHCNAYRTLFDRRIPIAFGSDCMPLGPLYGLHGAVHHPLESERLAPAVAWRLYTQASRALAGDAPGADFVVVNENPFAGGDWERLRVEATIRRGRVVWTRGLPGPGADGRLAGWPDAHQA
jgi:predicted amidohydrolase YtcJ